MIEVSAQILIDILTDLIQSEQHRRVRFRRGVGKRTIDVSAGEPRDVWPATRQIVQLNLSGRWMPGLEKGPHVLHVIGAISGFDPIGRIWHNEYARCHITRIQLRSGHALLNCVHHLAGGILQVTQDTAGAAFQRIE